MDKLNPELPSFLKEGERARLFPVIAPSGIEGRTTSCTLAALMSVDEFAKELLSSVGFRLAKTSKIECFTEVGFDNKDKSSSKIVFKSKNKSTSESRPDGLIVVTTGKKKWMALVEAKIGGNSLEREQVEKYLDLAKKHKINAVITLSNQFVTKATHHPLSVKAAKTKHVKLFHWSWTYLITTAHMLVKQREAHMLVKQRDGVTDHPAQAYILEELVRYLQHDKAGILSFGNMNTEWEDVCECLQNDRTLKKDALKVKKSVGSWHQLVRDISLQLSLTTNTNTSIHLTKAHRDNANTHLDDEAEQLVEQKKFIARFNVPDAADHIKLVADAKSRTITASMYLEAPKDIAKSKGRIRWLVKQLEKTENPDIYIKAIWASRAPDTSQKLSEIIKNGIDGLLNDANSTNLTAFEVVLMRPLAAKFKGTKTFIDETKKLPLEFYEDVGQHLKKWVAQAPKVKTKTPEALPKTVKEETGVEIPSYLRRE